MLVLCGGFRSYDCRTSIDVLNITGQKLTDYTVNNQSARLNLQVEHGIYFLRITTIEGGVFLEKIVIQ